MAPLWRRIPFRAYLKQVLVDGIFHADPHPGNIFLTDDKKIALLDLGMIGRTTPTMRSNLRILVVIVKAKMKTPRKSQSRSASPRMFLMRTNFAVALPISLRSSKTTP